MDKWDKYDRALEAERRAKRESIACLADACCDDFPFVTDSKGNWLTKEQLVNLLLKGGEED